MEWATPGKYGWIGPVDVCEDGPSWPDQHTTGMGWRAQTFQNDCHLVPVSRDGIFLVST